MKNRAVGIRVITIANPAIIVFGLPIDVTPVSGPNVISINSHENAISNDRSAGASPVIVRGIDELDIVIIRIAVDQIVTGVILKDIMGNIASGGSLIALNHNSVAIILYRILRNGHSIAANTRRLINRSGIVLDDESDQGDALGIDGDTDIPRCPEGSIQDRRGGSRAGAHHIARITPQRQPPQVKRQLLVIDTGFHKDRLT